MTFQYMPELDWLLGYPITLALMVAISILLYVWFRRSDWL
jgi:magnesium transporter